MKASLHGAYFDRIYRINSDPWDFASSPYEAAKYTDTIQSLPRSRYSRALEIGCSIGVLTERLAEKCERLDAIDVSAVALAQARKRLEPHEHVNLMQSCIPENFPAHMYDLFILSEVGYYWSQHDLDRVIAEIIAHARPQAHVLLVHWTPFVEDYPLTGDTVHETFLTSPNFIHLAGHRHDTYRLDLLEFNPL